MNLSLYLPVPVPAGTSCWMGATLLGERFCAPLGIVPQSTLTRPMLTLQIVHATCSASMFPLLLQDLHGSSRRCMAAGDLGREISREHAPDMSDGHGTARNRGEVGAVVVNNADDVEHGLYRKEMNKYSVLGRQQ
ncbi:Os05g0450866 [Oryza sativa Japonica Group]|uniref:Os05g0450866 protein n=1 Tax=Oryza sativa subsp. japonica TaxID=39947 RepID=A0A0P0WN21_ORYSJ|nr:Os05g0450866 [Oryza sativa Japonica Group]